MGTLFIFLSGIIATFIMILFLEFVTRTKLANADMVRAIGSIITRDYNKALIPGLIIQFAFGIVFSFIYFGILSYFTSVIMINGILLGGLMGFFHGIVVGFVGIVTIAIHHPITEFKEAGILVAAAHLFGHVVYGLSIGILFSQTGIRILVSS
ncbi:MAG: hypothetical protein GTN99_02475 [Candidatus Dadabacteria bacterium]|nr:hypothetical protein [Candidatus Dadabacteria bacterium]NIT13131.1 hypothetical protein [Candidatus Dadabacteria bacterium]